MVRPEDARSWMRQLDNERTMRLLCGLQFICSLFNDTVDLSSDEATMEKRLVHLDYFFRAMEENESLPVTWVSGQLVHEDRMGELAYMASLNSIRTFLLLQKTEL